MDVGVALKWVDLRPEVDPLSGAVVHHPGGFGLSAEDSNALELALRTAEQWGARVVAATVGPPGAEAVLHTALAAGAAAAIRVEDSEGGDVDSVVVAGELARVLAGCDLVWCGTHSADRGSAVVPGWLAAELGRAQALGVTSVEIGDPGQLTVERRLDRGRRERLAVRAPAVVSVEGGIAELRRASLPALLAAYRVRIEIVPATLVGPSPVRLVRRRPFRPRTRVVAGPGGDHRDRILALTGALSERTPPRTVEADPDDAAEVLLEQLRAWGYLE